MRSESRVLAGGALVVMIVLVAVGIASGSTWLTIAGVVGAIPSLASQFKRVGASGAPPVADDGSTEGIHGTRIRPTRNIGQAALENPPDSAPVAGWLKAVSRQVVLLGPCAAGGGCEV